MLSESQRRDDVIDAPSARAARRVLYYDGDCALCETARRWLSRLDFRRRVEWTAWQSLSEPPPGLTWADLEGAAWLDAGDGRPLRGFHAFRALAFESPLLWPLAPVLWIASVGGLGERAYEWVARNRCRLSGCAVRKGGQGA